MNPYQTHGSSASGPASGAAGLSSGQGTVLGDPIVTYPTLSHRMPKGVVAVPLNERDPEKEYTRWNGQAVEINDNLYSEYICPSDLNGVPCEHDELPGGCSLLRLCSNLVKYAQYSCPNHSGDMPPGSCPHIHDIVMSCRFVAKQHRPPHKICKLVEEKGLQCSYGHDLSKARQDAYDHYHVHLLQARANGSTGKVPFKKRW